MPPKRNKSAKEPKPKTSTTSPAAQYKRAANHELQQHFPQLAVADAEDIVRTGTSWPAPIPDPLPAPARNGQEETDLHNTRSSGSRPDPVSQHIRTLQQLVQQRRASVNSRVTRENPAAFCLYVDNRDRQSIGDAINNVHLNYEPLDGSTAVSMANPLHQPGADDGEPVRVDVTFLFARGEAPSEGGNGPYLGHFVVNKAEKDIKINGRQLLKENAKTTRRRIAGPLRLVSGLGFYVIEIGPGGPVVFFWWRRNPDDKQKEEDHQPDKSPDKEPGDEPPPVQPSPTGDLAKNPCQEFRRLLDFYRNSTSSENGKATQIESSVERLMEDTEANQAILSVSESVSEGFARIPSAAVFAINNNKSSPRMSAVVRPRMPLLLPWFQCNHAFLVVVTHTPGTAGQPNVRIEWYDSAPAHHQHNRSENDPRRTEHFQRIANRIERVINLSGWFDSLIDSSPMVLSNPNPVRQGASHQRGDVNTCGLHTILNAWSVTLNLRIEPEPGLDDAQWQEFYDLGFEVVNLALQGRLDSWTIVYFLECFNFARRQPGIDVNHFESTTRMEGEEMMLNHFHNFAQRRTDPELHPVRVALHGVRVTLDYSESAARLERLLLRNFNRRPSDRAKTLDDELLTMEQPSPGGSDTSENGAAKYLPRNYNMFTKEQKSAWFRAEIPKLGPVEGLDDMDLGTLRQNYIGLEMSLRPRSDTSQQNSASEGAGLGITSNDNGSDANAAQEASTHGGGNGQGAPHGPGTGDDQEVGNSGEPPHKKQKTSHE